MFSGYKEGEREGRGESFSRYTVLFVYPFSYQSAAQMANNYFSVCALPLASHQLFRDWCNPLLFMIVWDFWIKIEHNLLNNREEWEAAEWSETHTRRE